MHKYLDVTERKTYYLEKSTSNCWDKLLDFELSKILFGERQIIIQLVAMSKL